MPSTTSSAKARVKPRALQAGDTVGIVAPASAIRRVALEKGCARLRKLGYKPFYKESILDHDIYFAGTRKRRARELEEMFEREEVRAIICARGGYGTNYLLEEIDLAKIIAQPKIFIGYSDITTLLTWFADSADLVTFHGPMVIKDFGAPDGVDLDSWQALASGSRQTVRFARDSDVKALVDGSAEGILYGGCLSLLVASLGTRYEIKTEGTILFLEDVNAKPYQIDRMLMQLKLAGKLQGIRGLIFGEMLDCRQSSDQAYSLQEIVQRIVGELTIPVAYGFPSGHVSRRNITLPIGLEATLCIAGDSNDAVQLSYEAPVAVSSSGGRAIKNKR